MQSQAPGRAEAEAAASVTWLDVRTHVNKPCWSAVVYIHLWPCGIAGYRMSNVTEVLSKRHRMRIFTAILLVSATTCWVMNCPVTAQAAAGTI